MKRLFYLFLPIGLMAVGFGLQTYSSYRRQAAGETMLYGIAFLALLGLVVYFSSRPQPEPPAV